MPAPALSLSKLPPVSRARALSFSFSFSFALGLARLFALAIVVTITHHLRAGVHACRPSSVGLGALGIMLRIRLRVVPQFKLQRVAMPYDLNQLQADLPALYEQYDRMYS